MLGRSARLAFHELTLAHAEALAKGLCDQRVSAHFAEAGPATPEALRAQFARMLAGPKPEWNEAWRNVAIQRMDDGEWIGRLEATLHHGGAEVAYLLGHAHWGQGHAREALAWWLEHLHADHRIHRAWATVAPSNGASIRVLKACGFVEAAVDALPPLTSYDPGDRVFRHAMAGQ
jgi:RimJ/RimL family protein N-acetyltransferase